MGLRGIVKKQSCKSITIILYPSGIATGEGSLGCNAPISSIVALMALKSCSSLHFPNFFLITKMGVFQGLLEGSICPKRNCSKTKVLAALGFSVLRGHCSIYSGCWDFHAIGSAA